MTLIDNTESTFEEIIEKRYDNRVDNDMPVIPYIPLKINGIKLGVMKMNDSVIKLNKGYQTVP